VASRSSDAVDDDDDGRAIVSRMLEAEGHQVTEAGGGAAAIGIFERESPAACREVPTQRLFRRIDRSHIHRIIAKTGTLTFL
jgi:CheY-like chemotaxis protein